MPRRACRARRICLIDAYAILRYSPRFVFFAARHYFMMRCFFHAIFHPDGAQSPEAGHAYALPLSSARQVSLNVSF